MPLTVTIITPERSLPPAEADHVTLPAFDGEIGVRPGHAAMVTTLGSGLVHLKSASKANTALAVRGGVAQVWKNTVKILAEQAVPTDEINEGKLAKRLGELDGFSSDDPVALSEAKAEAYWCATQLRAAGKAVPPCKLL